jgi:hypothetical protein
MDVNSNTLVPSFCSVDNGNIVFKKDFKRTSDTLASDSACTTGPVDGDRTISFAQNDAVPRTDLAFSVPCEFNTAIRVDCDEISPLVPVRNEFNKFGWIRRSQDILGHYELT